MLPYLGWLVCWHLGVCAAMTTPALLGVSCPRSHPSWGEIWASEPCFSCVCFVCVLAAAAAGYDDACPPGGLLPPLAPFMG